MKQNYIRLKKGFLLFRLHCVNCLGTSETTKLMYFSQSVVCPPIPHYRTAMTTAVALCFQSPACPLCNLHHYSRAPVQQSKTFDLPLHLDLDEKCPFPISMESWKGGKDFGKRLHKKHKRIVLHLGHVIMGWQMLWK